MDSTHRKATLARIAGTVFAIGCASGAMAQSADRAGRWETKLGLTYNGSWDTSDSGGSSADVNSEVGFSFGVGYNLSDKISFGGAFEYDSPSYSASLVSPNFPNQVYNIRGNLENIRMLFDGTYNFMDSGPFSPFVTGILGWTWTDTNIATSPPQTGCWWDPWWGPICTTWQNTKSIDGLTYGVGLGARYDFNRGFAMQAAYRYLWTDYGNSAGTPSMDGFTLSFNWKF